MAERSPHQILRYGVRIPEWGREMLNEAAFADDLFWAKVDKRGPDECWEWQGHRMPYGHGRLRRKGRKALAHRVAYEALVGPVPPGLSLDHLCRNPPCVNPAHLEPVTHRINVLRGASPAARNAIATACIHGHAFDETNTGHIRNERRCKACKADEQRRRRTRHKLEKTSGASK